jgi:hypothetical protein
MDNRDFEIAFSGDEDSQNGTPALGYKVHPEIYGDIWDTEFSF